MDASKGVLAENYRGNYVKLSGEVKIGLHFLLGSEGIGHYRAETRPHELPCLVQAPLMSLAQTSQLELILAIFHPELVCFKMPIPADQVLCQG